VEHLHHPAEQLLPVTLEDLPPRPLQRPAEAFRVDGLGEVVERVDFKRVDRVLLERGDKDNDGEIVSGDPFEDAEPVHLRHLDIEEKEIGRMGPNRFDSRQAVRALRHAFHIRFLFQKPAESLARQRFVVDDDRSDRFHVITCCMWYGMATRTDIPPPGRFERRRSCDSP
jgi:hypothetical protein